MTDNPSKKDETPIHVLVILGAPITDKATPGPDMKERLDRALALMKRDNNKNHKHQDDSSPSLIVVTGGKPQTYGSSGLESEGKVMQGYLVAHGIPVESILVESQADHTFHNALYTRQALEDHGLIDRVTRITILTHDWHMKRSVACFRLVWCDHQQEVQMDKMAVPSDPTDATVMQRVEKEKHLIKQWLHMVVQQEQGSRCMPKIDLAIVDTLLDLALDPEQEG